MTKKAISTGESAPCGDDALCCPPEDPQAVAQLTAPIEGPAADDELAVFAKAIAHPVRVRILRMLAKKEVRMCDPASNLDEVLGVTLASRPTPVPDLPGLSALNINPDVAAHQYRERVVGPYRSLLPPLAVARMGEQLSGACTVEIAAFDEFTSLLADARTSTDFDYVIFDTAPTGHTLRLLTLPAAWTGFIDTNRREHRASARSQACRARSTSTATASKLWRIRR